VGGDPSAVVGYDMKILIVSRAFHPSIGGIETFGVTLARAWRAHGHDVRVETITPLEGDTEIADVSVWRRPRFRTSLANARWADVILESGIALRHLWISAIARRPIVIVHHGILGRGSLRERARDGIKRLASRIGTNVAVSRAVAATIPRGAVVIPGMLPPELGTIAPAAQDARREGLAFVGRLVSEKGVDVLLRAMVVIRHRGNAVPLRIYGDGPERPALERLVREHALTGVTFHGWADRAGVAAALRGTRVLVVPSRFEPFGIVALEALASGCLVVCSNVGGLPEAVGPTGFLVAPNDPEALAMQILSALDSSGPDLAARDAHLAEHSTERIASTYEKLFASLAHSRRFIAVPPSIRPAG
jgi:glycogen(starch) synthase